MVALLTSFIKFNTVSGSETTTPNDDSKEIQSSVFNLKTSVNSTEPVFLAGSEVISTSTLTQKGLKTKTKKVSAIRLGQRLLVIKGFSEDTTQLIEKESVDLALNGITPIDSSITPTVIDVVVSTEEGASTLQEDGEITEYEVITGDTVELIAKKFSISAETILWANDLKKDSSVHVGQKLVILPVNGVSYTIKSGDSVSEIADKFDVTQQELAEFNHLENGRLSIGEVIIIPGGKIRAVKTVLKIVKTPVSKIVNATSPDSFSRPVIGGIKTQGIHGHNGIDIAAPLDTAILASGSGKITLVRGGNGWNGGYGNYVVITHKKGIQTLYAHMNSISVEQGQMISKGQQVGTMGNTGDSTGIHLHFEVRGARNPF